MQMIQSARRIQIEVIFLFPSDFAVYCRASNMGAP